MNTELVSFVVGQPGMAERLLRDHVNDGTGRCHVCKVGAQRGNQTWPCTLFALANAAQELMRSSPGGASP